MIKRCRVCKLDKPLTDFGKDPRCKKCCTERTSLYKKQNKEKTRYRLNKWRKANPDKLKAQNDRSRLRDYGLTETQYKEFLSKQGGVCAVCKQIEVDNRELSIDHCHKTGLVRGLLCNTCNLAEGLLNSDPNLIRALANYVEYHERKNI